MDNWRSLLKADPLPWLLEPDEANPGVRFFAWRDLLDRPEDDPDVVAAQAAVMQTGPVAAILEGQDPAGYWVKPKPIYSPKYQGAIHQERINSSWFKFGYPFSYITDVLHNLTVLVEAGYGRDPRLAEAIELVLAKQDEQGRWKLEQNYKGKLWFEPEEKGQPSKWVTLRALRMLKAIFSGQHKLVGKVWK